MKVDDTEGPSLRPNYKGNSPLALESAKVNYLKNRAILENLDKKMVFESDKKKVSLLDENQIKE
jgi:hypothetical protein